MLDRTGEELIALMGQLRQEQITCISEIPAASGGFQKLMGGEERCPLNIALGSHLTKGTCFVTVQT